MIFVDDIFNNCINSPVRRIKGRVELYEGSTLIETFSATDKLKSFTVERTGAENKFFGFGICQKLTVELIDRNREVNVSANNSLEAILGTDCHYTYTNPVFDVNVNETKRDEMTNELTIIAYDRLYKANSMTFADVAIAPPYTLEMVAAACAAALGLPVNLSLLHPSYNLTYAEGANLEGTESLREVLDAIAEVTQSVYYIDHNWELTFKPLSGQTEPVLVIDKSKYFSLEQKTPAKLTKICHATELGENIIHGTDEGYTQYVRNNPFWENRDDIADLVRTAADRAAIEITPFNCSWRGNYLLEIGDKIAFVSKDNIEYTTYLLNDTYTYNGALTETTQFSYTENEGETYTNPATLGETIKYTYAKVDKLNKRIELVVSEMDDVKSSSSQIVVDTSGILNSVELLEKQIDEQNGVITEITNKVETQITPEQMTIAIREEMTNGIDSVTTSTGFTFNDEGMTISKTGREMTTTITEDGMAIKKNGQEVLVADNTGVKAENLHATTYLIIGKNSRLEDYNNNRTGCFWIGGA